jgi:hypothetical protein
MRAQDEKGKRIDLGLAIISAISPPGRAWSYVEIAAFCDCSKTAIQQIERKALRKLGNLFRFQDKSARELAAEFFERLAIRQPALRPGQERTTIRC